MLPGAPLDLPLPEHTALARKILGPDKLLLVEQKARRALEIAHEGYVMERGRVVESGETEALRNDPRVIAHYLGA